uniref:Uncharacterized protein n=1 Tax=Anguilla anguilla TaxID=7936 RepID=A0A0E9SU51_ANGAN
MYNKIISFFTELSMHSFLHSL